jgi:hypothetical protein
MTTSRNWYAAFGNVDKFLIYYGTIISIVMLPTLLTRNGISILWSISWRTFEIMTLMGGRKKTQNLCTAVEIDTATSTIHNFTCVDLICTSIPCIFCWV